MAGYVHGQMPKIANAICEGSLRFSVSGGILRACGGFISKIGELFRLACKGKPCYGIPRYVGNECNAQLSIVYKSEL